MPMAPDLEHGEDLRRQSRLGARSQGDIQWPNRPPPLSSTSPSGVDGTAPIPPQTRTPRGRLGRTGQFLVGCVTATAYPANIWATCWFPTDGRSSFDSHGIWRSAYFGGRGRIKFSGRFAKPNRILIIARFSALIFFAISSHSGHSYPATAQIIVHLPSSDWRVRA